MIIRFSLCLLLLAALSRPAAGAPPAKDDPHYNPAGFFDIHVCHWPDRPRFYLMLFSTAHFAEVDRIEVFYPDGRLLAPLDLKRAGQPEKRVFVANIPLPADPPAGWYRAEVHLKDGSRHTARDRVEIRTMAIPAGLVPADRSEDIPLPTQLSWQPVPDAKHYQVFIYDKWRGGIEIFKSPLLAEPRLALPAGLLQRGGTYQWRVHARDVNEHIELGDFNHGSLSPVVLFSVAD